MIKKTGYTIKELASHPWERNTWPPYKSKAYVQYIREDFKIIDRVAKAEIQKAYTKGFTPEYILDPSAKHPKFELGKDGVLHFVHEN